MGKCEAAVEQLTRAITLNPAFAEAYVYRSRCYRAQGKTALAEADMTTARSRLTPDLETRALLLDQDGGTRGQPAAPARSPSAGSSPAGSLSSPR